MSEVENRNASRGSKRVSFSELIHREKLDEIIQREKLKELIYREKLDEIKDLVLEKHNIDITSIIFEVDPDEDVPVADDAQPEAIADESAA